jgi:ferritin-like metal-binding protein YciE
MSKRVEENFVLYLNDAFAMEIAHEERIKERIQKVTLLPEAKLKFEHHLQETLQQQERVRNLITESNGIAIYEKADLPVLRPPRSILDNMKKQITLAEWELKEIEQDIIIENAEIAKYNMLIQFATKINSLAFAIPPLRQNLEEEYSMYAWLRANTPAMFVKLWPDIQSYSSLPLQAAEAISNVNLTFRCEICQELFASSEELRKHIDIEHVHGKKEMLH